MDKVLEMVLKSFELNRKIVENSLRGFRHELIGHKHNIFCFSWRRCRKMEKFVAEAEEKIREYNEAEKGLVEGNYDKAIEILNRIPGYPEETPFEIAERVIKNPPTLENILNSPIIVAHRMMKARDYLISLRIKNDVLQTS